MNSVIPAASVAQSQSEGASGVPSAAVPKTTEVLVIETPKQRVTPQQIMAVIPKEIRETVQLYLDGKIRQWYSRGDGKGVVFLVDAKTEDEARATSGAWTASAIASRNTPMTVGSLTSRTSFVPKEASTCASVSRSRSTGR